MDLLKILQEKNHSGEVNKLASQLQRSIYRTELQMKITNVQAKIPNIDMAIKRSHNGSPVAQKDIKRSGSKLLLTSKKSPYRPLRHSSVMESRMDRASSRTQDRSTLRENTYQMQNNDSPRFQQEKRGLKNYKLSSSQMFSNRVLSESNQVDQVHSSAFLNENSSPLLSSSTT